MIGRMFQRRGNQLVEVTNPSVILADTSNLVQGNTAPVYVNADTGNDANYGDTAATAVKTINKALQLAKRRRATDVVEPSGVVQIIIAGGTYAEEVEVTTAVHFIAQAPVTIDGDVYVISTTGLLRLGETSSFTIPAVTVARSASFIVEGTLNITSSDPDKILMHTYDCGSLVLSSNSNVNFTANNTDKVIRVAHNSALSVLASANVTFSGSVTGDVLAAEFGGSVWIDSNANLSGNITGRRFNVSTAATIYTANAGSNRIPGSQPGNVDTATFGIYG